MLESLTEYEKEYDGDYEAIARSMFSELQIQNGILTELSKNELELYIVEKLTILRTKPEVLAIGSLSPHISTVMVKFVDDTIKDDYDYLEIIVRLTKEKEGKKNE